MENMRCSVYILNVVNIIGDYFSDTEKFVTIKNFMSVLAIIISVANFKFTLHRNRKTDKEQKKIKEENDKKYVQQERLAEERERLRNELYEEMTRASVIPYFNLFFTNENIEERADKVFLSVKLVNIGKESASNIQLNLLKSKDNSEVYIQSKTGRDYSISEYLSKYYALRGDEVTFIIVTNRDKGKDGMYEKVKDSITFSITYFDCIINCYRQAFQFEYGMGVFSLKNTSYRPERLKDNQQDA